MKKTEQQLKTISLNIKEHGQQFKNLRLKYFVLKAINETNISIDTEAKQEVLNENKFYMYDAHLRKSEEYGKLITTPKQDYNMNDRDFVKYQKLAHEKRIKKGLVLPYYKYEWAIKEPWNLSSDCESRTNLQKCEKELIQLSFKFLPSEMAEQLKSIKNHWHWKHIPKYLDIILRQEVKEQ